MRDARNKQRWFVLGGALCVTTTLALTAAAAAPAKKGSTKKAAPAAAASNRTPAPRPAQLRVVERIDKFTSDYEAEVYSGVPLSDPYAKERGLEHGLVWMAFENTRQLGFRVPKEKLKLAVRMVVEDDPRTPPGFALASRSGLLPVTLGVNAADPVPRGTPKDRVDVLFTTDGTVVVTTSTSNAGIFTSSDVFLFPKGDLAAELAHAQRAAPTYARERLREAITIAHSPAR